MLKESTSKLDSKGANTSMGPSGPRSELIYQVDICYEGWIDYRFTLVHKGHLAIMQSCIKEVSGWN